MALSGTLQLTCNYIPGCGVSGSKSFSNSLVSRRTVTVLPFSSCLKSDPKRISFVCRASSSGHRRNNPDFSRHNRNVFRGRNRRNEDRDGFDGGGGGLEDSDILSSKNGPLFLSSSPKFQATSSPGPREKEIVDLFRKVQAQLRARAAAKKEDKKTEEASKGQGGKETETVDSLLKLLRKHSGEQSKKNAGSSNSEKQLQGDDDAAERHDHSSNHFDSRNRDHNAIAFTRPPSSFKRNSPVPRHKPQSSYSSEAIFDEASSYSVTWTQKKDQVDSRDAPEYNPEPEYEPEPEPGLTLLGSEPELKPESFYHEDDEEHDVAVDEVSGDDDESINAVEEPEEDEDLRALKLIELRAIAKSRGHKGISKMKKAELLNLLCSNKA